jgi:DNA-binding response OmpR family regulator
VPDKTILVVEDEENLRETLRYKLNAEGYRVVVAADGEKGIELARSSTPDLVLLDVMLPRLDGFDVCRILRKESTVPIIMLTAKGEELEKVVGLEVGADDYVTKPFSMRELLARIKALLRRADNGSKAAEAPEDAVLTSGDLRIDPAQHRARLGAESLELKPREFDLLVFLIKNRGRAFSRDQLLDQVWGYNASVDSRTVDVHMRWLREKIEADPGNPQRITTIRGLGYRFEG